MKVRRHFRHLFGNRRIMLGERRMRAARIDECERVTFGHGQALDPRRTRAVKIHRVESAECNTRLIEQSARLSEIYVLGKFPRLGFYKRRNLPARIEHVDDLRDQHLERRRRGHARAAEYRRMRDGGKTAERIFTIGKITANAARKGG